MCGGKQQTQSTTSGPPPEIMDAYRRILGRAEGVAGTPYQQYGGNLQAGFTPSQTSAFGSFDAIPGQYLPQAANYATQGASPITGGQIEQYYNPFQQGVTDATIGNINETNARQLAQVKGNAISQGALGGSRLGVGQGEVIRQQNLGNAPTLANLNAQNYQQAYGAAAADRAAKSQGAYTFGNLQNVALQGAGAQMQSGAIQQQQQQQALNIPYQQFLQQQAFPYQQTGWLAGLTSGIGSLSGGNSQTTSPGPNPLSQYGGLGLAAMGMFLKHGGKVRGYDQGGGIGMGGMPYGGAPSWIPGMQMARGNGPPPPPKIGQEKDDGASKMVSSAMDLSKQLRGRFSNPFAEQPYDNYDAIYAGNELPFGGPRADGGMVMPNDNGIFIPLKGYDVGGGIGIDSFGDRFAPATEMPSVGIKPEALTDSYFSTNGADPRAFTNSWQDNPPLPRARPEIQDEQTGVPLPTPRPQMADQGYTEDANYPDMAAPTQGIGIPVDGTAGEFNPQGGIGISPKQERGERSFGLGILPESWKAPMIAAGFGMMASRSPFLGQAIGEGGMKGFEAYEGRRKETQDRSQKEREFGLQTRRVDMEADRLSQAAKQASERLAIDTKRLDETIRQHSVDQMKPVKIGESMYGDIMAVRDPATGTFRIIDKKTGQLGPVVDPTKPLPPSITSTPAESSEDASIPAKATLVSGDGLRDEEFLKTVQAEDARAAATVKGLVDYEINPSALSTKGGHREKLLGLARLYDKNYDMAIYPARAAAMKEFIAGGPNSPAGNITSGNTAIQHLGQLAELSEKIGGTNDAWILNKPLNWLNINKESLKNNPALARYVAKVGLFAEEATKFYRGTGGALADIERSIKDLTAAQSPEARAGVMLELAEAMGSKINAFQDRWKTALGGPSGLQSALKRAGVQDFPIIHQKSAESLQKIDDLYKRRGLPGEVSSHKPTNAESGPKVGEEKQFKQGVGVWDGTRWVPKKAAP